MARNSGKGKLPFLKNGIAQIAFVVKDLEETVKNYWKYFGIGPWHFYTYGDPLVKRMSYKGKPTQYKARIALSWIGSLRIELIEMMEGETIYKDFVEKHGYGIQHIGVLVEDMENAIMEAEASGFSMTQDGTGFGAKGDGHYAYLDTENAIGTTIELIKRPKDRMPPEKVYPPEDE